APAAFTARRARPAAPHAPGLALPVRRPHSPPECPRAPATSPHGPLFASRTRSAMDDLAPDTWNVTPAEAREMQLRLRERLITHPPRGFAPRLVGGADLSIQRFARRGYAGIVVIDAESLETVEEASAAVDVTFPYIPGLLSFRELP